MKTVLDVLKGLLTAVGLIRAVVPSVPEIPVPRKGPKVNKVD